MTLLFDRERFTNARTTNFYYSFIFLPSEKRRAIEAVYAFARRGDDAVDGHLPSTEAERELARCRRVLDYCYGTDAQGQFGPDIPPEVGALARAVRGFKIPRRHFDDLMLGFEMDLHSARYATFDDLLIYCYRVASTIGLISIEIFGYRNPRSRDYAVNLGTALQLVNILRDLHSDAKCGRIYLPEEDLERFELKPETLREGRPDGRFGELMRFECDRARHYFGLARQALPPEDRPSMLAAEIMASIYWRLLSRIERSVDDIFRGRVRLSRPEKLWAAVRLYLGAEWYRQDF